VQQETRQGHSTFAVQVLYWYSPSTVQECARIKNDQTIFSVLTGLVPVPRNWTLHAGAQYCAELKLELL
jgi:hypothetical protein